MLYVVCFQGYVCGSEGVLVLKVSDYVSGSRRVCLDYVNHIDYVTNQNITGCDGGDFRWRFAARNCGPKAP